MFNTADARHKKPLKLFLISTFYNSIKFQVKQIIEQCGTKKYMTITDLCFIFHICTGHLKNIQYACHAKTKYLFGKKIQGEGVHCVGTAFSISRSDFCLRKIHLCSPQPHSLIADVNYFTGYEAK